MPDFFDSLKPKKRRVASALTGQVSDYGGPVMSPDEEQEVIRRSQQEAVEAEAGSTAIREQAAELERRQVERDSKISGWKGSSVLPDLAERAFSFESGELEKQLQDEYPDQAPVPLTRNEALGAAAAPTALAAGAIGAAAAPAAAQWALMNPVQAAGAAAVGEGALLGEAGLAGGPMQQAASAGPKAVARLGNARRPVLDALMEARIPGAARTERTVAGMVLESSDKRLRELVEQRAGTPEHRALLEAVATRNGFGLRPLPSNPAAVEWVNLLKASRQSPVSALSQKAAAPISSTFKGDVDALVESVKAGAEHPDLPGHVRFLHSQAKTPEETQYLNQFYPKTQFGDMRPPTTLGMNAGQQIIEGAADFSKNVRSFPKLADLPMPDDPSVMANKSLELVRSKAMGAQKTWAERARSWRMGTDEQQKDMLEYLDRADWEQRAKDGATKLPGGIDPRDNFVRLHELRRKFGIDDNDVVYVNGEWIPKSSWPGTPQYEARKYFDSVMGKVEEARGKMLDAAKESGQLQPSKQWGAPLADDQYGPSGFDPGFEGRKDYVPHVQSMRFQDKNRIQMLADTEAHNRFNLGAPVAGKGGFVKGGGGIRHQGEKHYEGSTKELEGDAFTRLAWKGAQVDARSYMNKWVDRFKPLEIDTTQPGFQFQPGEFLLNKDGGFLKDAAGNKIKNPNPMGAYDKGDGTIAIFPRHVALALSEAGEHNEPGMISKILGPVNNLARIGLLKLNPGFHTKQVADDLTSMAMNVPLGRATEAVKIAKKHAEVLFDEFSKVNGGEFSPVLEKYRESGIMNEIYEGLVQTVDDVRRFSEDTQRGHGGALLDIIDEGGQIRETAAKAAIRDIYMMEGATPERATSLANQWMGDYISQSKTGREIGQIMPMMKWFSTAAKRLTVGAIEDPITGNRIPRGLDDLERGVSASPWSKIVPAALAAGLWNKMVHGKAEYDGLYIPGTDYKVMLPGYAPVASGEMFNPDNLTERFSMGIQAPVIMGTSLFSDKGAHTLSGKPLSPYKFPVSKAQEAEENARRGGIGKDNPALGWLTRNNPIAQAMQSPLDSLNITSGGNVTPEAQKIAEGLFAPIGQFRRATSADDSLGGNIGSVLKMLSPLRIVNGKKESEWDFKAGKDEMVRSFVSSSPEKRAEIMKAWVSAGGDVDSLLREIQGGKKEEALFKALTRDQRELLRKMK